MKKLYMKPQRLLYNNSKQNNLCLIGIYKYYEKLFMHFTSYNYMYTYFTQSDSNTLIQLNRL